MIYKFETFTEFEKETNKILHNKSERIFIAMFDGLEIDNRETLYDNFMKYLNFPDYFGRNWDALDECLTDFAWLNTDKIIIIFKNFKMILKDENSSEKEIFYSCITDANEFWESEDPLGYKDNPDLKVDFYLIEN